MCKGLKKITSCALQNLFSLLLFFAFFVACSTPTVSSEDSNEKSSSETAEQGNNFSTVDGENCSVFLDGKTEWSWDVPKECRLNPDIEYGSLIDRRDGQVYKTVTIGDQTWMAQNLNYDPGLGGSGNAKYVWSWCFNDVPENCDVGGRLYSWAAAIDSAKLYRDKSIECGEDKLCSLPDIVYGICPSGWHLPTEAEWETLFTNMGLAIDRDPKFVNIGVSKGGKAIKSKTGWQSSTSWGGGNGTDIYGFSAMPVGLNARKGFSDEGQSTCFWIPAEDPDGSGWFLYLNYDGDYVNLTPYGGKSYGFSVRCVKN